jgi:hypothetical protein
MNLRLTFLTAVLAGLLSPLSAQIVKPIDINKQADINGKNVSFDNVQFDTISQPTRELPKSTISKGNLKLQSAELNDNGVDFKSLDMPTVSKPIVQKANFTAKRAVVDNLTSDENGKQRNDAKQKAPITNRQIRPFLPGGEDELKKQLNEMH